MTRGVVSYSFLKGTFQCLALLWCLSITFEVSASSTLPPLLKQSQVLACAKTESVARSALSSIWDIEDLVKEFPDENMQSGSETTLHAATLDIVLKSMLDASQRFPSLRNQVERTLLKWNYCDVFQEGVFYDLKNTNQGLQRLRAAESSPEKWQGFKALGFLGEVDNRFIPNILAFDQNNLRSDYEWLFHRIYREQCFPHPDTSELFDASDVRLKENIVEREADIVAEFPYEWDSECVYPRSPPKLTTEVNIEVLPIDVPVLMTQLELIPVAQLVPGLKTQLQLLPVEQLVPSLATLLKLVPVPQVVPDLQTQISLTEQPLTVPQLTSVVAIHEVPQLVPTLVTKVNITPLTFNVPTLQTVLLLEEVTMPVPGLLTKLWLDKPKYVAPKPVAVKYVGAPVQKAAYYPATKNAVKPNIAINKNASLIERLLGGLSGGGNVLIVDKIQLTVNEYNGTVETAISSSDVGTTVTSTHSRPEIVKEVLKSLPIKSKQKLITATKPSVNSGAVKEKPKSKPKPTPKPKLITLKKSPVSLGVPKLRTMLLVSEPSYKSAKKRVKTGVKASKRKRQSSVFTYSPYRDDKKKTADKSIEQLLLEYQQYEKDRKLGRLPKKSAIQSQSKQQSPVVVAQPQVSKKPDARMRDVPPLNTELWVEETTVSYDPVIVPSLNSKVKVYKKFSAKPVKVPALSTMIIQQFMQEKPLEKQADADFKFSNDHFSDEVFEATKVQDVKSIKNQLDQLFDEDLSFSTDRISDKVFEETLNLGKKKAEKKNNKQTKPKKKPLGLAGNVYLKHSLKSGKEAVGGSINRKLIKDSYWFARVGWNYALETSEDPFSYSWGIGYSDWHSGTFSAQLNNWGPIKPEEGLALEKAVASFGYSVKSEFLKKNKLSLSGAINVPVEGNSSAAANLRWSPVKNWYVNASVSQPLEGDGTPKWTYGFGYSDWRPNKINLQYSNYGPNEIPYHNYEENGTWSLSYNWKF